MNDEICQQILNVRNTGLEQHQEMKQHRHTDKTVKISIHYRDFNLKTFHTIAQKPTSTEKSSKKKNADT